MKQKLFSGALMVGVAFAAGGFASAVATSDAVAAELDLSGQRVVWIVPSREGGGSDNFTRAIAPHLAEHLPGKPKVVIRNIPGNGTIPGTNQFLEQAKGDGLMIITNSTSALMNQVLKTDAVRYDLTKFNTIMAVPQGTFAYARPDLGVKGPDDIKKLAMSGEKYRFGGFGPTSAELRMLVSWELLGIGIKPLWGLSRGKVRQAFMRGETQLNYDTASSWFKKVLPLVKQNEAVPLFTFGIQTQDGKFIRDPVAPNMPHYTEVYERLNGEKLAGPAKGAWEAVFNIGVMASKSIALPPSATAEVKEGYLKAIKSMLADPKFEKAKAKRIGPYPVAVGAPADAVIDRAINMSPDARNWLKEFLKKNYDVELKS